MGSRYIGQIMLNMELPGSKRGKEEDLREDQCDRGGYYCMVDWGEFVGTSCLGKTV